MKSNTAVLLQCYKKYKGTDCIFLYVNMHFLMAFFLKWWDLTMLDVHLTMKEDVSLYDIVIPVKLFSTYLCFTGL